ncbi:hypothetical protein [Streptomyces sp. NPDC051001]|uniref:hypothetical protein n=1 Tax=Streptomyces sp. NPDC051001 TaxID=3155795 RepID=UPI00341BB158
MAERLSFFDEAEHRRNDYVELVLSGLIDDEVLPIDYRALLAFMVPLHRVPQPLREAMRALAGTVGMTAGEICGLLRHETWKAQVPRSVESFVALCLAESGPLANIASNLDHCVGEIEYAAAPDLQIRTLGAWQIMDLPGMSLDRDAQAEPGEDGARADPGRPSPRTHRESSPHPSLPDAGDGGKAHFLARMAQMQAQAMALQDGARALQDAATLALQQSVASSTRPSPDDRDALPLSRPSHTGDETPGSRAEWPSPTARSTEQLLAQHQQLVDELTTDTGGDDRAAAVAGDSESLAMRALESGQAVDESLVELFLRIGPPPQSTGSAALAPINSGGGNRK